MHVHSHQSCFFTASSLTHNIAKYVMEKADEDNLASYWELQTRKSKCIKRFQQMKWYRCVDIQFLRAFPTEIFQHFTYNERLCIICEIYNFVCVA